MRINCITCILQLILYTCAMINVNIIHYVSSCHLSETLNSFEFKSEAKD